MGAIYTMRPSGRAGLLAVIRIAATIGVALFPFAVSARAEVPDVPPVRLAESAEAAHIRDLIHQLAKMDHADFGVTSYAMEGYGMAFAPDAAPDSQSPYRLLGTRRERFPAFVELVRLGPRALPYLLQAMDNLSPTRLQIWHYGSSSMMPRGPSGNRANARETKIIAEQSEAYRRARDTADKAGLPLHRAQMMPRNPNFVTVGDICMIAIGQITGRDYQHLFFQGDGDAGLSVMEWNYDAVTPATLRAIWFDCSTPEAASRHLLDSLLLDYRSRAGKPGQSGEDQAPFFSDDWQISAAQRLLFYYSKQTAPMIAARLNALHVGSIDPKDSSSEAKRQRESNQVDVVEFIEAVAECPDPTIRAAIRAIFLRSDDVPIWLACLPALDSARDWTTVDNRLGSLARKSTLPFMWFVTRDSILIDLRNFGGERARPLFREFQKKAHSVDDCDTLISVLALGGRELGPRVHRAVSD